MHAITIQLSDELLKKVQMMAQMHDVALEELIVEVMAATVRQKEARELFEQLAAQGRGREQEALELLRR